MKILILGKSGQVGAELQHALKEQGTVICCDRIMGDLSKPESLVPLIRNIKPSVIINAAAYTAVDKAETDQTNAMTVNGIAPGVLAEEAKRLDALFVHYSTDYVFNGQATQAYQEDDATDPLNYYGHSKLAGENAVAAVGGRYIILRTSWVYGTHGKNFFLTMLRLAKEKDHLKIVQDQVGAPTWSREIAENSAEIVTLCQKHRDQDFSGTYHMTAGGRTSWHGFAEQIFELFPKHRPQLTGIPSSAYPLPAKRPAFSVLDNGKLERTFNLRLADWQDGLRRIASDEIFLSQP